MHLQLLPCLLPTPSSVNNGYHQCWAVIRRNQMNAAKQLVVVRLVVLYAYNNHDTPTQQMKKHTGPSCQQMIFSKKSKNHSNNLS
jgi:hypothetical protein